jgi:hypothetical protein
MLTEDEAKNPCNVTWLSVAYFDLKTHHTYNKLLNIALVKRYSPNYAGDNGISPHTHTHTHTHARTEGRTDGWMDGWEVDGGKF